MTTQKVFRNSEREVTTHSESLYAVASPYCHGTVAASPSRAIIIAPVYNDTVAVAIWRSDRDSASCPEAGEIRFIRSRTRPRYRFVLRLLAPAVRRRLQLMR